MTASTPTDVLVTGATGFLGLNLVRLLLEDEGLRVHALCGRRKVSDVLGPLPESCREYNADLADVDAVRALLAEVRPALVAHLAGKVDLSRDNAVAKACVRANISGTLNLLEACRGLGVARLVYLSTVDVYGPGEPPFAEDDPLHPASPYSVTKAAGEMLCRLQGGLMGFDTVVLRLTNAYGPHQPEARLVPSLMAAALAGRDLVLTSGEVRKDFIHARDAARAVAAALTAPGAAGQTINLGSGRGTAIKVLAERIATLTGGASRVVLEQGKGRSGEPEASFVTTDKARDLLGFTPALDLDQGLAQTLAWRRETMAAETGTPSSAS